MVAPTHGRLRRTQTEIRVASTLIMSLKQNYRLLSGLFCAAAGLLLAIYIWYPITNAWWYITDDYRWPTILGDDGYINFREFLTNCNPSDWHLGSKVNRPTYYFTTSAMMYFFGENIVWWNITRIAMMASSLAAVGWVVARAVGAIPSLATIVLLGFHSMWLDALPRLQSELFSLFGLSMTGLFAWAVIACAENDMSPILRRTFIVALCLSSLYATGSKENITVLMAIIAAVTLIASWVSPSLALATLRLPAALALLCSCILFYFIFRGVISGGTDLYGRPIRLADALRYFSEGISNKPIVWILALSSLLAACVRLRSRSTELYALQKALTWNAILQACIVFYAGFLVFFYRGWLPELNCRYQFPYALLPLLGLLVVAAVLRKAPKEQGKFNTALLCITSMATPLLAHNAVNHLGSSYSFNITGAERYTRATNTFHDRLALLVAQATKSPSSPILFISHGFNDFEPLLSIDLFLKAHGCQNIVYLDVIGYSETTAQSDSELHLARLTNGLYASNRFRRPEEIPPEATPIKANFSRDDLSNGAVANFWPLF